ncbi:MAG: AMP nucleosidase, partial [Pseudomonadota bacterium]
MSPNLELLTPEEPDHEVFDTAEAAVRRLKDLYRGSSDFLCTQFSHVMANGKPNQRIRAFYPELRLATNTYAGVDSRLSFGHVVEPGRYSTTITRPDLFE